MNRPPITLPARAIEAAAQERYDHMARQVGDTRTWRSINDVEREREIKSMAVAITAFLRRWL